MQWSVARRIALALAAVVTVCGGWLLLAPTTVGGPVSFVVTSGISMQPTFHTGDLAVLRSSSSYHVGDVVGYHSRTLHNAVVMHRLVSADGNHFTTKGDHNTWLDPDHPTSADIVGKLWLHVPRGGILLTRMLLPLALLAFIALLLPFKKRQELDENGDPVASSDLPSRRNVGRGRHSGNTARVSLPVDRLPDWLSPETCARLVAGGLALAIVGSGVAIMGYGRPLHRTATASRSSQTTVKFGWSGAANAPLIYPGGRVTDPQPIFPKVVNRIIMTADVSSPGQSLGSPSLVASLSDTSGWTHQWSVDASGKRVGQTVHLSGTLDLGALLAQVASVQATTGVSGAPTLKLSVDDNGGTSTDGPSLSFALSNVTLKPQGPLTVTSSQTKATRASLPATVTLSGHKVRVSQLRHLGLIALALGLLLALAGGLITRRLPTPTPEDKLRQLFAGRVVYAKDAALWERSCLDVSDPESLSAFAAAPGAVLYVVGSGDARTLIAERGQTRLRHVPGADAAPDPAPHDVTSTDHSESAEREPAVESAIAEVPGQRAAPAEPDALRDAN